MDHFLFSFSRKIELLYTRIISYNDSIYAIELLRSFSFLVVVLYNNRSLHNYAILHSSFSMLITMMIK